MSEQNTHIGRDNSQLLKLIEYCQNDNRICPSEKSWNGIYHAYSWHTDVYKFTKFSPLKSPLILDAWNTSNIEKKLRLLTQIYWCHQNGFTESIYEKVVQLPNDDWHMGNHCEGKISLEVI